MARYTGPRHKACRRERTKLFPLCQSKKCPVDRRPYPPGEHGRGRIRESDYLIQLREKQKLRTMYGVLEKQFRNLLRGWPRQPGITGENLLRILESRLDNVVWRAGFAETRPQARQLVNHGHFR
jgi:small subunit ribosomal protein S4